MNTLKNYIMCMGILAVFLLLPFQAEAAEAMPQAIDFSCKGVSLGDTSAKMLQAFGKPIFDKDQTVQGIQVRYYTFAKNFVVGVAVKNDKVVDFQIKNQQYEARDGIKYGATAYKIKQTYGKKQRTFLDGVTYYVYDNPVHKYQRLLLEADPTNGSLLSMRITNLPLTDEEVDLMAEDEEWDNRELTALTLQDRNVDTSAVDKHQDERMVKLKLEG